MPRTYVKKKPVTYDKSALESALTDVEKGTPIRVAAKKNGIPFETLRRWTNKPPSHQGSGRNTVLTQDEKHCKPEESLTDLVSSLCEVRWSEGDNIYSESNSTMTTPPHSICSNNSSKTVKIEIQELVCDTSIIKAEENGISSAKATSMPVIEKSLATIQPNPKTDGTFNDHPTLEEIRQMQANFATERNWDEYHQPRNLLLAMVGEVGELAELFQWRSDVTEGLPNWSEAEKEHLGQELSDVLLYLIRLSEKCHIDLPQAVIKKLALNAKKYPAPLVSGSSKKYTEYESSNGKI